jgi:hypothetical protein
MAQQETEGLSAMMVGCKLVSALEEDILSLAMRTNQNLAGALVALLLATALLPMDAKAITVEVAKKCNALLAKEFPPRQPGNPAAGSIKGNGQAERDYFKKCVENGGNADSSSDKK